MQSTGAFWNSRSPSFALQVASPLLLRSASIDALRSMTSQQRKEGVFFSSRAQQQHSELASCPSILGSHFFAGEENGCSYTCPLGAKIALKVPGNSRRSCTLYLSASVLSPMWTNVCGGKTGSASSSPGNVNIRHPAQGGAHCGAGNSDRKQPTKFRGRHYVSDSGRCSDRLSSTGVARDDGGSGASSGW